MTGMVLAFIAGLFLGAAVAVVVMSLCIMSGRTND